LSKVQTYDVQGLSDEKRIEEATKIARGLAKKTPTNNLAFSVNGFSFAKAGT
jgi:hypothetical protein